MRVPRIPPSVSYISAVASVRWTPAFGVGPNFGRFAIDVAGYTNDANVERERHPAIAVSLRFGSLRP